MDLRSLKGEPLPAQSRWPGAGPESAALRRLSLVLGAAFLLVAVLLFALEARLASQLPEPALLPMRQLLGGALLVWALAGGLAIFRLRRLARRWQGTEANLVAAREELEERVRERTRHLEARTRELDHERAFLARLVNTAGHAQVSVDAEQRVVYWNAVAEKMFGFNAEEMRGQHLTLIVPERFRQAHADGFARACESGRLRMPAGTPRQVRARHRDGREFDVEVTFSLWEEGGRRFFTAVIDDISQRLVAEQQLQTLSQAVEQSPVTVVLTDPEGVIVFANKAVETITGYPRQELLGQNPRVFQSGLTPHAVYEELWQKLKSGQAWEGELINRKKDGSLFREHARMSPVFDEAGGVTHFLAIKEDVTALRKAEVERDRQQRLQRTLSACNQTLVRAHSETEFLQTLCTELVAEAGYSFAWVGYADSAEVEALRVAGFAGEDQGYLAHFNDIERARSDAGAAIRQGQMRQVHHRSVGAIPEEKPGAWETEALARGFKTSVALPVVDENQGLYAVLNIFLRVSHIFGEEELNLLKELAEDLRYGIHNHRVREALEESMAQFRCLAEDSRLGVYMIQGDRFIYCNPRMAEIFACSEGEVLQGRQVADIVAPESRSLVLNNLKRRYEGEVLNAQYEFQAQRFDGETIEVEVFGARTRYKGAPAVVGSLLDVTQRNRQTQQLRLLYQAFKASREAVMITDSRREDYPVVYVNPAFERLTGYTAEAVKGRNPRFVLAPGQAETAVKPLVAAFSSQTSAQVEVQIQRAEGRRVWVRLTVDPVCDDNGVLTHYVTLMDDISEQKRYIEELEKLTHFDTVTGLPNRMLLRDRLYQALIHGARVQRHTGLMLLDINRFKTLTHSLGAEGAEATLREVAQRLQTLIRDGDTLARVGNDQFMVLLSNLRTEADLPGLARKILAELSKPLDVGPEGFRVTASAGLTLAPLDGNTPDELLRNAQAALLQVNAEPEALGFFTPEMNQQATERLTLEADLRRALRDEAFELYYQPKIRLADGAIVGAEALIRWRHPERGMVFPDIFIPLAEATGLIRPMGDWVVAEACRFMARVNEELGLELSIAVNFSAEQFEQPGLPERVRNALEQSGLKPWLLECELTESLLMNHPEEAVRSLNHLKTLGARVALDDFGTGYSSLSYLKRFPIDTLKIDRSFVMNIPDDTQDLAITEAMLALAQSLDIHVVAEGVEALEQAQLLHELGCQCVQGFYFSRPVPAADFRAMLEATPEPLQRYIDLCHQDISFERNSCPPERNA